MKKFLEYILKLCAKATLALNQPKIIGITGSVGKSSTKEAVALVLAERFSVRASPGNLNSQLGLPLAILGFEKAGGFEKNLATALEWTGILVSAVFKIFQKNYPKILVLEMGTDRPGDIAYLLGITKQLDAAVITDIGISHMEYFSSPQELAKEKLSILKGLDKHGVAVLNADNAKVMEGKAKVTGMVISYGFGPADIQAQDLQPTSKNGMPGISFKVNYKGNRVPFFIPNALGKPTVYVALAAAGVGISFGLNLVSIAQALEKYKSPAGRMNILEGLNGVTIIDDTYNAAPSSTIAALEALASMNATRKLAALGHMAELGNQTEAGHREVAAKIVELGLNTVFLVGDKTKFIEDELSKRKFSGKVFRYADSDLAAAAVKQYLLSGDLILVKGSQSARMEKVVKSIMIDPAQAKVLLVRQGKEWLKP